MGGLSGKAYLIALSEAVARKTNTASAKRLPYLNRYATDILPERAKSYSKAYQHKFTRNGSITPIECLPRLLEEALFFHGLANRPNTLFEMANLIRDTIAYQNIVTADMYLLMLQGIKNSRGKALIRSAVALYIEAHQHIKQFSQEDRNLAASLLLDIYSNCKDVSELLLLKIAYENYMTKSVSDRTLEARYIGAFIQGYLNTGQYIRAVDLFERGVADLHDALLPIDQTLKCLPTKGVLISMSQHEDVKLLTKWLRTVLQIDRSLLDYETWSEFLSIGLYLNHYELVKLIYLELIMHEVEGVSLDEIMFSKEAQDLEKKNKVLSSLSEETLAQILYTLSSNGDVNSTLRLIEWHFLHKKLKGEKGLTKELCIAIIKSYCYHDDGQDNLSLKNVLEVIDSFSKLGPELQVSFRDISDAMSYRFMRYDAVDPNVEIAKLQEQTWAKQPDAVSDEMEEMPRKIRNLNLHNSEKGNILKNSEILDLFVREMISFIQSKQLSDETLQTFLNCVLHHLMKYQNATGLVVALMSIHQLNPRFALKWFNKDLFDLILKTIAKSPASKLLGYEIYLFMQRNGISLSSENFGDLIALALHGEEENDIVKLYMNAVKKNHFALPEVTEELLRRKNAVFNSVDPATPIAYSESEKVDRKRYYEIDKRDSGYLRLILNKS